MNKTITQQIGKLLTGLLVLIGLITFLPVIAGFGLLFGIFFGWMSRAISGK